MHHHTLRILGAGLALALSACSTDDGAHGSGGATPPDTAAARSDRPTDPAAAVEVASARGAETAAGFYRGTLRTLEGEPVDLADYRGKVTLVVNVASRCGYTPQYAGLQKLNEELGGDRFAILAFPSNDFGGQEPGSAEQIRSFCTDNYGVTFTVCEKVKTAGAGASELYDRLAEMTGERPSWNFCKYLISPDGTRARFFGSRVAPESDELRAAIRELMQ
ncbi:MAG: glutathione peroxidase [Planctomycetes bacterium]|nr:glutathione peroxidase [Planctomycetota bacterium]